MAIAALDSPTPEDRVGYQHAEFDRGTRKLCGQPRNNTAEALKVHSGEQAA